MYDKDNLINQLFQKDVFGSAFDFKGYNNLSPSFLPSSSKFSDAFSTLPHKSPNQGMTSKRRTSSINQTPKGSYIDQKPISRSLYPHTLASWRLFIHSSTANWYEWNELMHRQYDYLNAAASIMAVQYRYAVIIPCKTFALEAYEYAIQCKGRSKNTFSILLVVSFHIGRLWQASHERRYPQHDGLWWWRDLVRTRRWRLAMMCSNSRSLSFGLSKYFLRWLLWEIHLLLPRLADRQERWQPTMRNTKRALATDDALRRDLENFFLMYADELTEESSTTIEGSPWAASYAGYWLDK